MPASTVECQSLDVSTLVGAREPSLVKRLAQSAFGRDFLSYDPEKQALMLRPTFTVRRLIAFKNLLIRYQ